MSHAPFPVVRLATSEDVPDLVNLMGHFHAESGYALDRSGAEDAFAGS